MNNNSKLHPEQIAKLQSILDVSRVKTRDQSGRTLSYLEGYDVMATANEIFGFDGWSHSIVGPVVTVSAGQLKDTSGNFVPGWISKAKVRIGIRCSDGEWVYHTDVGLCVPAISFKQGYTEPTPDAIETSEKGAVTDAMKRAFRALGDQFGNSLYDKDDEVSKQAQQNAGSKSSYTPRPTPAPKQAPAQSASTTPGKPCPNCGGNMEYKSGMKGDKPWAGYFCENTKSKGCKPEWSK